MSTTKPAIVLAHGIWHSPLTYQKLTSALQQAGYEVHAPFLPSCIGARPPTASLAEDTAVFRRLVEILASQGRSVVVVAHSYGGMVGSGALEGLDAATRAAAGQRGGVTALVGIAAHLHPAGFGVLDIVREMGNEDLIPAAFDIADDGSCFSGNAPLLLGLPDAEAALLGPTLSRANIRAMEDKLRFEGWRHVPVTYVHTTEDMTLPAHYQQRILEKMEKAGVKADVVTLKTGHSPHVTMTDEVVKVIEDVAKKAA